MICPKAVLLRRSWGRREKETRKSEGVPPGCTDHRRRQAQHYELFGACPAKIFWATETGPFQRKGEGEGIVRTQEMQKIPDVLPSQWEGARKGRKRPRRAPRIYIRIGGPSRWSRCPGIVASRTQGMRMGARRFPVEGEWGSTQAQERAKQGVTKTTS